MSATLLLAYFIMSLFWQSRGLGLIKNISRKILQTRRKCAGLIMTLPGSTISASIHKQFIESIAKTKAPERIDTLVQLLAMSGEEIIDPAERNKQDLNPFLIPLSKDKSGSLTCYIRWPTQKETMDLQIVRTTEVGVVLRSLSTDNLARRLVAELDFMSLPGAQEAYEVLTKSGLRYTMGEYVPFLKSGKFDTFSKEDLLLVLDRYLLTKVGAFPDCYQRLADNFLEKGDAISALITCERAVSVFYGWGHPMTFHARMLSGLSEREKEAKDVAKAALGMPKWTLAETREQLDATAKLAGFSGLPILGEMHAFRANDPRTTDINEGTSPIQVTLDQVAHYMDAVALGHYPGGWSAARDIIASKYEQGGYPELVDFIKA